MSICIIPVSACEEKNSCFRREVNVAMEEALCRLEDSLRSRLTSVFFTMRGEWADTRFNQHVQRTQPMQVDVEAGMEVSVLVDVGVLEGDYERGIDFFPHRLSEEDIEEVVDTILHELRLLDVL